MARVVGPLMSIEASGTFAKTLVYSKWKGRPYVRERVIPANPKSAQQTGIRAMFGYVAAIWGSLAAPAKASWEASALAKGISAFNEYASVNMTNWQNSLAPIQDATDDRSTGDASTPAVTATGAAGYATLTAGTEDDTIGVIILRSTAAIVTPSWADCIAVIPLAVAGDEWTFTDSPLPAGTYHYRVAGFTPDGKLSTFSVEDEAVVT